MTAIDFSPAEIQTGKISPVHLSEAVNALREDGYVILNELVAREHCGLLRDRLLEDVNRILARDDVPYNFNVGNIQQEPPPFPPYLFRDVLVNDIVIDITRSLLGAGLKNAFYSGNTALPGKGVRQPVHADTGQLWPDLAAPTPPYALVVNVLPVDVSPENGSTEIWPGTHTDPSVSWQSGDLKVPLDRLEARRAICPPIQPVAKAGSVIIRDIRMWHAGMPNYSAAARPMIAMIHFINWWDTSEPLIFAKGTEPLFEHPHLTTVAKFVEGEIDYLVRRKPFDVAK